MIQPAIGAIILAGGEGRRVGYVDKGLIEFKGKPLVKHVFDVISQVATEVVVSCNRNHDTYRQLVGITVADQTVFDKTVSSTSNKKKGPIAGILSGMEVITNPYIFVCPCDTPYISPSLITDLYEKLMNSKADVAVVHDGQRRQNLHCLMRRHLQPRLNDFFSQGNFAIKHWYNKVEIAELDCSTKSQEFINYNDSYKFY